MVKRLKSKVAEQSLISGLSPAWMSPGLSRGEPFFAGTRGQRFGFGICHRKQLLGRGMSARRPQSPGCSSRFRPSSWESERDGRTSSACIAHDVLMLAGVGKDKSSKIAAKIAANAAANHAACALEPARSKTRCLQNFLIKKFVFMPVSALCFFSAM